MKRWLISRHWTGGSSEQRPWETANKVCPTTTPPSSQNTVSWLQWGRWKPRQSLWSEELRRQQIWGEAGKLNSAGQMPEQRELHRLGTPDLLETDWGLMGMCLERKHPKQGENKYQKEGSGTFIKIHGLGIVCVRLPEGNVFPIYGNWVKPPEGHCLSNEAKLGWDYGFSGPPLTQPKRL